MNSKKINLDINRILELLPHRYPILLIDRVLHIEPHKSIKALKNVSINEPFFSGHFPKRPVMPGVLIIEAFAQAAALLMFTEEKQHKNQENTLCYFAGIDSARFKRVVEPGDQMILSVIFKRNICGILKFKANAEIEGKVAAEAKLMCMIKSTNSED
ncbi:MAG: 3-hydroxyacyl-ACP dehydratase FabZ [Burkholderia sp.]|nr:3-hydroxyacyl-ACP dehydratase FabZ [Burkholderia sp.]